MAFLGSSERIGTSLVPPKGRLGENSSTAIRKIVSLQIKSEQLTQRSEDGGVISYQQAFDSHYAESLAFNRLLHLEQILVVRTWITHNITLNARIAPQAGGFLLREAREQWRVS